MDTNKMREQFENAWLLKAYPGGDPDQTRSYGDLTIDVCGNYIDPILHHAWWAWQASREAVVVELPSACAYEGLTEHLGSVIELSYEAPEHDPVGLARLPDVRAAIEAQGLKVAP